MNPTDVRVDVFTAGKSRWARLTHLPTGFVVQGDTSQRPVSDQQSLLADLAQKVDGK